MLSRWEQPIAYMELPRGAIIIRSEIGAGGTEVTASRARGQTAQTVTLLRGFYVAPIKYQTGVIPRFSEAERTESHLYQHS